MCHGDGWEGVTFIKFGWGRYLYCKDGLWGCEIRGARGSATSVVEPTFDVIYALSDNYCVGKRGGEWIFINGDDGWAERKVGSLEETVKRIHLLHSHDAAAHELATTSAVQIPDEPLLVIPGSTIILFPSDGRVCVADGANQFLLERSVVPLFYLMSEGIVAVTSARHTLFVGKADDKWIVFDDDRKMGSYDSSEVAFGAAVEQLTQCLPESLETVDELVAETEVRSLKVFRVGERWAIGKSSIEICRPDTEGSELLAKLYPPRFVSPEFELRKSPDERETRIVGQTETGWMVFDEGCKVSGVYDSLDCAWDSVAEKDRQNEPEPVGLGYTDFPLCNHIGGPGLDENVERAEGYREAGVAHGDDPDESLRHDETIIDAVGLSVDKPFINLTPGAEYGCYLPVEWFTEFLQMKEGESCSKDGFAWFYESPNDTEQCTYRASVVDNTLHVEVEVGREAVVRRASFGLYAGEAV